MEDMSKKGKRLEKENEALKRQKEATTANIIHMAEERQEWKRKIEAAEKKNEKLMSIIQQMQQQGRKVPPAAASTVEACYPESQGAAVVEGQAEGQGEDSEYSDEEGEEEGLSEFDDDTEEEPQPSEQSAPVPYGPERPPQPATNGH